MSFTCPQTVPGQPDKVSVIFFGHREIIDRSWYDKVTWMANASRAAFDEAFEKARAGELSPLDEEYWRQEHAHLYHSL